MEENELRNITPRKRGRPKKGEESPKTIETNLLNSREFRSFEMSSAARNIFGLNMFDIFDAETLASVVKDPMGNNDVLRNISNILYSSNGVYTNTVDYLVAMATLDNVVIVEGENVQKKKRNKKLMESTLKKIKHREIMRDALFRGCIDGVAYYYFETIERPISNQKTMGTFDVDSIVEINQLGLNASVISLPADYTEIIGIKNNSYVIAFDLDYFSNGVGESAEKKLKKYPKEIRDAYANRINSASGDNGRWVILDNSKTIVHKIRSSRSEKYGRPLCLAAISDIMYGDYFRQTKRGVLNEINNKVVYETFPEGKEKGSCALTQKQQREQHDTVKRAVQTKNNKGGISFFSVAAGTKLSSLDVGNLDIFDEKNEGNLDDRIAMDLGIASSLLSGSGSGSYSSQTNNLELLSAQLFQWIEQIESELNKCINANIIKDENNVAECKYLPITHCNKTNIVNYAKDLYMNGKGSLSLWASACGISPRVFFALLDQELEEGIEEKYPVHKTSYNTSGGDSKGGRPTDESSQNPSTLQTKANGSNNQPKPSTK